MADAVAETLSITAVGETDRGQVRASNQDSFLSDTQSGLFIVADGMGGHAGGEIASQLCIRAIAEYVDSHDAIISDRTSAHPNPRISGILADAVNYASTKIYERALEEPTLKGMGTTATAVKVIGGYAYCAHVGDSRLYLRRQKLIYQLTLDHSLVSEQVRAGILTPEEAEAHSLRNVITRSVGYQEEEDVDTIEIKLENEDTLLLCSDGLHGKVDNREISNIVGDMGVDSVPELIALANERGGEDNITVVVFTAQV